MLSGELGGEFEVIEEGLNGRTTVWDDPIEGYKSGKRYLPPCLETHKPLDLVTILLGTNDLKKRFSLTAMDISEGAGVLVDIVKGSEAGIREKPPAVILVAPPEVSNVPDFFREMFEGAEEKSKLFSKHYRRVAEERDCYYLDASEVINPTGPDGIHFEKADHEKFGKAVASKIREIGV